MPPLPNLSGKEVVKAFEFPGKAAVILF